MAFGTPRGALTGGGGSTADPSSATGSVAVSVGDLIFVSFVWQNAGPVTTDPVSDNLGSTYTALTATSTDGALIGRAFYSYVGSAGTLTQVDIDTSGASGNNWAVRATVFEGPFDSTPLDANPANIVNDTTSPFTCPATGTLAQADELVVAWVSCLITGSLSATSPNLLDGEANDGGTRKTTIGYQVVSSTSTVTPEFTSANTPTDIVLGTASFKKAAGGTTDGAGSAGATFTGSGAGASTAASAASAAATFGASGAGASTAASAGAGAAAFGAAGVGSSTAAAAGAAPAVFDAPGVGDTVASGQGAGSASAVFTATGVGASIAAAAGSAAIVLGASGVGADAATPAPEVPTPPATVNLFGGVGGVRRELSEKERRELLRRVRKSLGLDKEPLKAPPAIVVPSMVGPISAAAIQVRAAAAAREIEDEEIVVLAAACW